MTAGMCTRPTRLFAQRLYFPNTPQSPLAFILKTVVFQSTLPFKFFKIVIAFRDTITMKYNRTPYIIAFDQALALFV